MSCFTCFVYVMREKRHPESLVRVPDRRSSVSFIILISTHVTVSTSLGSDMVFLKMTTHTVLDY